MKKSQPELPKLLILMGHPRSGTTILNGMCNIHPDIAMTREFFNMMLPQSFNEHFNRIRKNFLRKNPIIFAPGSRRRMRLISLTFFIRYLFWLLIYSRGFITADVMQKTLGRLYPGVRIIGDKKPTYLWMLSNFEQENTYYVLIYRDGRDVVQSALNRSWGKVGSARFSTARKAVKNWIHAIDIMEENRDKFHIICYEDLVTNPREEMVRLAKYLDVDPDGFKPEMIKSSSVGKYKEMLTEQQIADVLEVAGPTLERLGYSLD